jgi:hypothetical protein
MKCKCETFSDKIKISSKLDGKKILQIRFIKLIFILRAYDFKYIFNRIDKYM